MRRLTVLAVLLALSLTAAHGWAAPMFTDTGQFFRLDWEATQDKAGHPVVDGYVYNTSVTAAENMRVLVEALDSSGQIVGRTYAYVIGTVPSGDRAYFQVKAPTAQSYRVQVNSFDWRCSGH